MKYYECGITRCTIFSVPPPYGMLVAGLKDLPRVHAFIFGRMPRPYDPRMWCALAEMYETLGRDSEAIKSYKRALLGSEIEINALNKLAKLYAKLDDNNAAAYYYTRALAQLEQVRR
jgi:tetratricopeptide (TPR) repeat protein